MDWFAFTSTPAATVAMLVAGATLLTFRQQLATWLLEHDSSHLRRDAEYAGSLRQSFVYWAVGIGICLLLNAIFNITGPIVSYFRAPQLSPPPKNIDAATTTSAPTAQPDQPVVHSLKEYDAHLYSTCQREGQDYQEQRNAAVTQCSGQTDCIKRVDQQYATQLDKQFIATCAYTMLLNDEIATGTLRMYAAQEQIAISLDNVRCGTKGKTHRWSKATSWQLRHRTWP